MKEVSDDYRHLHVKIPLKWYGKNLYGTMFGGWMCAVADPLPALLVQRIFRGTQVWTKRNSVDFLRPASSALELRVHVTQEDVNAIQAALDEKGHATHTFRFPFKDKRERNVAMVTNVIYVRRKGEIALTD